MKFRLAICLALMFLAGFRTLAQDIKPALSKVSIGDDVPDYLLPNIINLPVTSANLRDFKGKILILDFWNSMCSSCFKSWPELMKLQLTYKDKIQIILVNPDEKDSVIRKSISSQERLHGYKMTLAVAFGNKTLKEMFPHSFVPHVIYIDSLGVVKYITTSVAEGIIQAMLQQKALNLNEKTDEYADITWSKPLFINGNVANKDVGQNVIFSSVITPYSPSMYPMVDFIDSQHNILNGRTQGVIAGRSLYDTFQFLYGRDWMEYHWVYPVPKTKILMRDVDTTKLVRIVNGIPRPENLYAIQVTAKNDIPISRIRKRMIADLEENFALKTGWEKQRKLCYVVSRTNSPLTVYKQGIDSLLIAGQTLNFNNISMQEFLDRLVYYTSALKKYPVVDETNYHGKLGEIFLKSEMVDDYKTLAKELLKHGLQIAIMEREVDVLIISGNKKSS
jgi:thiol-disulfide isomerase/thioredoxin